MSLTRLSGYRFHVLSPPVPVCRFSAEFSVFNMIFRLLYPCLSSPCGPDRPSLFAWYFLEMKISRASCPLTLPIRLSVFFCAVEALSLLRDVLREKVVVIRISNCAEHLNGGSHRHYDFGLFLETFKVVLYA